MRQPHELSWAELAVAFLAAHVTVDALQSVGRALGYLVAKWWLS